MSFWNIIWFIIVAYAFVAYLTILFAIVRDLFRDRETSGWAKAAWTVFLIAAPILAALAYLIVRGRGMAERQAQGLVAAKQAQDAYIRQVAGTASPTDQIATAQALLGAGSITQSEFNTLKVKALA